MLRKIIRTELYRPERTVPSARGRIDYLECGHEAYNKGSVGEAERRKCQKCTSLSRGAKHFSGNTITTWDKETLMPVTREMTIRGPERRIDRKSPNFTQWYLKEKHDSRSIKDRRRDNHST